MSENSLRTRRDIARIEIAMEGTVRERLLCARKAMMEQLTAQLDVKTRLLVRGNGGCCCSHTRRMFTSAVFAP